MRTDENTSVMENKDLIDGLSKESLKWNNFLNTSLKAIWYWKKIMEDILAENYWPPKIERTKLLLERLEECCDQNKELRMLIQEHRKDISVMMDCEEVDCEEFYLQKHAQLFEKIENWLTDLYCLKLKLLQFKSTYLKAPTEIFDHEKLFN